MRVDIQSSVTWSAVTVGPVQKLVQSSQWSWLLDKIFCDRWVTPLQPLVGSAFQQLSSIAIKKTLDATICGIHRYEVNMVWEAGEADNGSTFNANSVDER